MEGPDPDMHDEGNKKESSWEIIREWFRLQKGINSSSATSFSNNMSLYGTNYNIPAKGQDLRLLLGVLGCPLAPIPFLHHQTHPNIHHIKDIPFVSA